MLHVLTFMSIFTIRRCGGSRCTCRSWRWCRRRRCCRGGGGCTGRCFYRTTIIIYQCMIMPVHDTTFAQKV